MIDEALAGKQHFDALMAIGPSTLLVVGGILAMLILNQALLGIGAIVAGVALKSAGQ